MARQWLKEGGHDHDANLTMSRRKGASFPTLVEDRMLSFNSSTCTRFLHKKAKHNRPLTV